MTFVVSYHSMFFVWIDMLIKTIHRIEDLITVNTHYRSKDLDYGMGSVHFAHLKDFSLGEVDAGSQVSEN